MVVAAAEEERFSRVKHESRVPLQAIEFCLSQAGLTMREVDVLAFPEKPYRTGPDSKIAAIDRKALWRLHREGHARRRTLMHHVALRTYLRSPLPAPRSYGMDPTVARALATVREAFGSLPQIRFFDHHEAHAALAYYASGLERAAVATVDGRGDPYATVTWAAEGRTLRRLRTEPWSNSLGFFYRDATAFAGLGEFGEGKMMGLAAYGDPGVLRKSVDELLDRARKEAGTATAGDHPRRRSVFRHGTMARRQPMLPTPTSRRLSKTPWSELWTELPALRESRSAPRRCAWAAAWR